MNVVFVLSLPHVPGLLSIYLSAFPRWSSELISVGNKYMLRVRVSFYKYYFIYSVMYIKYIYRHVTGFFTSCGFSYEPYRLPQECLFHSQTFFCFLKLQYSVFIECLFTLLIFCSRLCMFKNSLLNIH